MPVSDDMLALVISQLPNFVGMLIALAILSYVVVKQMSSIQNLTDTVARSNEMLARELVDIKHGEVSGASLLIDNPGEETQI